MQVRSPRTWPIRRTNDLAPLQIHSTCQSGSAAARSYQAERLLRRRCMPRLATSFARPRCARFRTRDATLRRLNCSGGVVTRRPVSSSSPSNSVQSVDVKGDMVTLSKVVRLSRASLRSIQNGRQLAPTGRLIRHLLDDLPSSPLPAHVRRLVFELLQNASRFAAQQSDVALAVDARQIHPHSQLPRPHFA